MKTKFIDRKYASCLAQSFTVERGWQLQHNKHAVVYKLARMDGVTLQTAPVSTLYNIKYYYCHAHCLTKWSLTVQLQLYSCNLLNFNDIAKNNCEVLRSSFGKLFPRPQANSGKHFSFLLLPYQVQFATKNLAWQQDESWAELLTKIKDYFQEFLRKLSRISSSNSFGE